MWFHTLQVCLICNVHRCNIVSCKATSFFVNSILIIMFVPVDLADICGLDPRVISSPLVLPFIWKSRKICSPVATWCVFSYAIARSCLPVQRLILFCLYNNPIIAHDKSYIPRKPKLTNIQEGRENGL